MTEAIARKTLFNILHKASVTKIDFIIQKDSLYRLTEFERRREIQIQGEAAWIVSPEDLIISKLDWAKDSVSEFQLRDVEDLFKRVKDLDLEYITKWVSSLGLQNILSKVKR